MALGVGIGLTLANVKVGAGSIPHKPPLRFSAGEAHEEALLWAWPDEAYTLRVHIFFGGRRVSECQRGGIHNQEGKKGKGE